MPSSSNRSLRLQPTARPTANNASQGQPSTHPTTNRQRQARSAAASHDQPGKTTMSVGIRAGEVADIAEKRERKKRQNTASARRCRERKRIEKQKLETVFQENERRIQDLEDVVDVLYTQLNARPQPSSRVSRSENIGSTARRPSADGNPEEGTRPNWFGASF